MAGATPEDHGSVNSDLRLRPASYVVLGLIDHLGPLTSYELKQKVELSVGYFWPFPHTQLYTEPQRLVDDGLLSEDAESGGRRRRTYSITARGVAALEAWVAEPSGLATSVRDHGLLQLFFADAGEPGSETLAERTRQIAAKRIEAHQQRLSDYQALANDDLPLGPDTCRGRTLLLGLQLEQLMIEFWRGVESDPPKR